MNKCSAKIILRKELLSKKTGEAPLALQVFVNGRRKVFALNHYIKPDQWDPINQVVTGRGKEINNLNLVLANKKGKAVSIFTDYHLLDVKLTTEKFADLYLDLTSRKDFIKFYETEMQRRFDEKMINKGCRTHHNTTLKKLKKFKAQVAFADIDKRWLEDFDNWHYRYLKTKAKKRNIPLKNEGRTTRFLALKNIRTYLNLAISTHHLKIDNAFKKGGMVTKGVKGSKEFLDPTELRRMIQLYTKKSMPEDHRITLIRFLVSCFTSLRISDNMLIGESMIKDGSLVFKPVKTLRTQKTLSIPLNAPAKFFIEELLATTNQHLTDQRVNKLLKVLAAWAEIDKHITTHVARHTFATLFLKGGGQVHVLQEIMGHADIRTTMEYVHILNTDKQEQIFKLDELGLDLLPDMIAMSPYNRQYQSGNLT